MRLPLLVLSLFAVCTPYKYLIFNPLFGHSHTKYLTKIADILFEAGHEVTIVSTVVDDSLIDKTGLTSGANIIILEQDPGLKEIMEEFQKGMLADTWVVSASPLNMVQMFYGFKEFVTRGCRAMITNTTLLDHLHSQKFDVGIAEPFFFCGYGLFDHLGIPSTISAMSEVHVAAASWYMGEPLPASYVPAQWCSDGAQMSLFGRFKNSFGTMFAIGFLKLAFSLEAQVLTENLGKDYSDYGEFLGRVSLAFVNSNPYLNYPRPLLQKTLEIGGITVDVKKVGHLGEHWDAVLNEQPHTVFVSFGSMHNTKDMPEIWKNGLLEAFKAMPQVTFIWKYEESTDMADHLPNVFLSPWLPQNALLADPRLSLFITHGGLGSTNEVSYFGKPAIMIPIMGDQLRNSEMLARHGGALVLQKEDLANSTRIQEAIQMMLEDRSYSEAATRLAELLHNQPRTPKDLVISHCEFVAKFGPLTNLDPYGRKMSMVEYYLLDVIVCVVLGLMVVLVITFYVMRMVLRRIFSRLFEKSKTE